MHVVTCRNALKCHFPAIRYSHRLRLGDLRGTSHEPCRCNIRLESERRTCDDSSRLFLYFVECADEIKAPNPGE